MKRIREFADECGCTPQNIYIHLETYKEKLEGHIHKGSRGKVLDAYACQFLRTVMNPKEVSAETQLIEELNKLRALLVEASTKNSKLVEELSELKTEHYKLQQDFESKEKLLLESNEHGEALKNEINQISKDLNELQDSHQELTESNQKLKNHYQELTKEHSELQREKIELAANKEKIEEELEKERTRKLSISERFFGYKKK